eukprot:CFRG5155T1
MGKMDTSFTGLSLLEAAATGDALRLKEFMNSGVDVNFSHPMNKYTALHWASKRGNPESVELLLRHGADPTLFSADGKSPADLALNERVRNLLPKDTACDTLHGDQYTPPTTSANQFFTPAYLKHPTFPYTNDNTSLPSNQPPSISVEAPATSTSISPEAAYKRVRTSTPSPSPSHSPISATGSIVMKEDDHIFVKSAVITYLNELCTKNAILAPIAGKLGKSMFNGNGDEVLVLYLSFGKQGMDVEFVMWAKLLLPQCFAET